MPGGSGNLAEPARGRWRYRETDTAYAPDFQPEFFGGRRPARREGAGTSDLGQSPANVSQHVLPACRSSMESQ